MSKRLEELFEKCDNNKICRGTLANEIRDLFQEKEKEIIELRQIIQGVLDYGRIYHGVKKRLSKMGFKI